MEDDGQSEAERRQLRHNYRSLLSDAATRKKEYLADDGTLLLDDLERANSLFNRVKSTTEGILDSRFLILSADIGAQRAHQMRIDSTAFDSLEYIDRVRQMLVGHASTTSVEQNMAGSDWSRIGVLAQRFTRAAPGFSCIYGPLMTERKERKRVERKQTDRSKKTSVAESRIESVDETDVRKQENQTTKLVRKVHDILARSGPINLFQLVINPESFAQSVENIFYVSFLIRDGRAYIDDQSGQPMIEACEPPQQDDYQMGLTRKQLIFSLDQTAWQEIIDVYGITQCVIPSRVSKQDNDGLSQIASQVRFTQE
ncbi:hypothetical protein H4R99_003817 [Coemansia sp. RSA 1722]|nr:hypothetical protein LPJ57_004074 [Coemansia sp. RSA 486]KAJ2237203.1 hypothetical protein IWW45_001140 [Coemansia sp. RSA 485]KAJ2597938.1 hypothetical protein GGF39_002839 [Coemansia sp. RSA 1721]KAJ2599161.1 hypothetical protein H4R99_003817 [Coemansia sp. RSA 1722]